MTKDETEFLEKYMHNSKSYFEWGSGKSTKLACNLMIPEIISIEGDIKYLEKTKKECPQAAINYIDIGADNSSFSTPKDNTKNYNWPSYFEAIFEKNADLILIDGRFRVMCAINVYLYAPQNCKVLIHDYPQRPHYHIIEQFFTMKEKCQSLCAFSIKSCGSASLFDALKTFKYDWR